MSGLEVGDGRHDPRPERHMGTVQRLMQIRQEHEERTQVLKERDGLGPCEASNKAWEQMLLEVMNKL